MLLMRLAGKSVFVFGCCPVSLPACPCVCAAQFRNESAPSQGTSRCLPERIRARLAIPSTAKEQLPASQICNCPKNLFSENPELQQGKKEQRSKDDFVWLRPATRIIEETATTGRGRRSKKHRTCITATFVREPKAEIRERADC